MILLDVNVLLALHRSDHPHHDVATTWFGGVDDTFAVLDESWSGFVRLTTNRRIFAVPETVAEAFAFVEAVRAQPHFRDVDALPRRLALLEKLCSEFDVVGDLVPDAALAAAALSLGAAVASFDRDFARFTPVLWIRPGEEPSAPG